MTAVSIPSAWGALSDGDVARALLEAFWEAPVAMAVFSADLRIVRVNDAMALLNGVEASEHVGRRLHEVVPGIGERAEEPLREVLRTGRSVLNAAYTGETAAVPGARRDWLGSVFPVRDPRGESIGVCVVVNEISTLRRQEEDARRARAEAERATRRLERLQQVGSALSKALTPAQVARVILEVGLPLLEADACAVSLADDEQLAPLAHFGFSPDTVSVWELAARARPAPHLDAIASGNAVWLESPAETEKHYPEFARQLGATAYASAAVVPLLAEGRALGVLSLAFVQPRAFDSDDRSFILALAAHCAQALRRARLFEAEQQQRARAEESALLLDTFIAAVPCGLAFLDTGLRYRKVNPALAAIDGSPVADHLGKSVDEIVAHPAAADALRHVLSTGEPLEGLAMSSMAEDETGRRRSWLASIYPVSGADRALVGVGAAITEVTSLCESERERERLLSELQAALRERDESMALVELLLDAAPIGFALLDPELRFVKVNRPFASMCGRAPLESFAGKTAFEVVPSEYAERATEQWRHVLETGEPMTEVDLSGEDCGRRWAYLGSWFPVRSSERVIGVGLVVRDVSEQRAADEFQRHLLGIVGHDLRSPLAAIAASAAYLLRDGTLSRRERKLLDRIRSSSWRIERIVADLLDFTQVRAGKGIPITKRPAELDAICRQVIDEVEASSPNARIACAGTGDGTGEWDAVRIGQLLANLVTNALKHGKVDGPVRVAWRGELDEVVLEVRNEGTPIEKELLGHLFEPFQQGAHHESGIGLGLFIARQIAAAHCGTIEARSDDEGTVFCVRLPRCPGR